MPSQEQLWTLHALYIYRVFINNLQNVYGYYLGQEASFEERQVAKFPYGSSIWKNTYETLKELTNVFHPPPRKKYLTLNYL